MQKKLAHRAIIVLCVIGGLGAGASSELAIPQTVQAQAIRSHGASQTRFHVGEQVRHMVEPQVRHA